jgi:mono/diheme cytochrome c family protein
MKNPFRKIFFISTIVGLVIIVVWTANRAYPESSPVARGAAYAETLGCVGCHGDSDRPLADGSVGECSNRNKRSSHPDYNIECSDVMAYFEAIRLRRNFNDRSKINAGGVLISGERLARQYHCFQCHGELGQGGFKNLRSLKGYIPGYFGNDFRSLTKDGDQSSVREWISHGVDHEILETVIIGRIAEFFLNREAISMPKYNSLDPKEIDVLVNYVIALNQYGPMSADIVRSYGADTQIKR